MSFLYSNNILKKQNRTHLPQSSVLKEPLSLHSGDLPKHFTLPQPALSLPKGKTSSQGYSQLRNRWLALHAYESSSHINRIVWFFNMVLITADGAALQ
jgi:hypothetical protein